MLTTMASAVHRMILVLALALPGQAPVEVPATPPPSITVVIDPGHGGDDLGAVGPSGLEEKLVTLNVAQRVRALGGERGVRVLLTREDDRQVSLLQRAAFANGAGAAVFISLHANAGPSPVSAGAEVASFAGSMPVAPALTPAEERALLHAVYLQDVISIPEIGRSLGWSDDGVHRLLKVLSNKLASIERPPLERTPAFGVSQVAAITRTLRSQLHAKRR